MKNEDREEKYGQKGNKKREIKKNMSVFVYVYNKNYWNESRPREYRLSPEAARGWTRTANYDEFFYISVA